MTLCRFTIILRQSRKSNQFSWAINLKIFINYLNIIHSWLSLLILLRLTSHRLPHLLNKRVKAFLVYPTTTQNLISPMELNRLNIFQLITICSKVITVANSVAHFAGALGKKTILWLPEYPTWRWGQDMVASDLYPSIELKRS